MVLITIPNIEVAQLCILLDLLARHSVKHIYLKVHHTHGGFEVTHITPSIYASSNKATIHGIQSLDEVKEISLDKKYQILSMEMQVNENTTLEIDVLKHTIVQKSKLITGRPLTQELLAKHNLLGQGGFTTFTDIYQTRYY